MLTWAWIDFFAIIIIIIIETIIEILSKMKTKTMEKKCYSRNSILGHLFSFIIIIKIKDEGEYW